MRLPVPIRGRMRTWIYRGRLWCPLSETNNLVVTAAAAFTGDVLRQALPPIQVLAIGTSTTAPALADVKLGIEIRRSLIPVPGTDTFEQRNLRTGNVVTLRTNFLNVTGSVAEMGLFGGMTTPPGDPDEGVMINHALMGPDVCDDDAYVVEVELTFG